MKKTTQLLLMLICSSTLALTSCKKEGCTDSKATNYNSEAKKDDGSCKFAPEVPKPPVITTPFTAKIDGVEFIETSLSGTYESFFGQASIEILAQKGDEYIRIKVPANINPGTYKFDAPFTGSIAGFYNDGSTTYGAPQGTGSITIVSRTSPSAGTPGKISGIFNFTASSYEMSSGNDIYEITSGQFKVDYQ